MYEYFQIDEKCHFTSLHERKIYLLPEKTHINPLMAARSFHEPTFMYAAARHRYDSVQKKT